MTEILRELEAWALASAPDVAAFRRFSEMGLHPEDLTYHRDLYQHISFVIENHGGLPLLRDIRDTFNLPAGIRRDRTQHSQKLEELYGAITLRNIQQTISSTVQRYGSEPPHLAGELVRALLAVSQVDRRHISLTDTSAEDRFKEYAVQAIESDKFGLRGIPTGLSVFDSQAQLGWLPGELISIIGRPYIGKSYLLMWFGVTAWMNSKRVLFISPEMPREEAEARWDVLVAARHNVKMSLTNLYRGWKPTPEALGMAAQLAKEQRWLTITSAEGKPFGLGDIAQLIQQQRPELVLVDGLGLLRSEGRGNDAIWERISNLSYGLKNLAMGANVPIILTHQANRSAANLNRPPLMHEISGGDGLLQACDRMLSLSLPTAQEGIINISLQKFRRLRAQPSPLHLYFDPGQGDIHEQPITTDDPNTPGSPEYNTNTPERGARTSRKMSIP